jgi:hypothetical protein
VKINYDELPRRLIETLKREMSHEEKCRHVKEEVEDVKTNMYKHSFLLSFARTIKMAGN